MLKFLELLHPLLNDALDFSLGDNQDFLIKDKNTGFYHSRAGGLKLAARGH